jgi:ActR/RegA family two-component response regulator
MLMHDGLDMILYVDDDEQINKYFRLLFARDYQVLTAASAKEALNIIEREDRRVAMIISDQRMPERTGVELLEEVKERYPRIIRLITTAYSDMSTAIAAVNRGSIYAYISKPWNTEELKLIIRRAFEHMRQQRELGLLRVEKDGFCQNLLFFDRLRSIGMLASIGAHWINRPLAAAAAYWRDSSAHFLPMFPSHETVLDLPAELLDATGRLARGGLRLSSWLGTHCSEMRDQQVDAAELASFIAVKSRNAHPGTTTGSSQLIVDLPLLVAGMSSLVDWLLGLTSSPEHAPKATLGVRATASDLTISIGINGSGRSVPDGPVDDLAGLQGYLAAYHHGGTIAIDHWGAKGGLLKVVLPCVTNGETRRRGRASDDGLGDFMAMLSDLKA